MKRGDLDWSISEDDIAAIKWKDKHVVTVLFNTNLFV